MVEVWLGCLGSWAERRGGTSGRGYIHRLQPLTALLIAMPAVVIRQRKAWRRKDGVTLYFEVRTFVLHLSLFLTNNIV